MAKRTTATERIEDIAVQVLSRMDTKGETVEQAFEAVTGGNDRRLLSKVAANLRGE
jgi:hypothetical protein